MTINVSAFLLFHIFVVILAIFIMLFFRDYEYDSLHDFKKAYYVYFRSLLFSFLIVLGIGFWIGFIIGKYGV